MRTPDATPRSRRADLRGDLTVVVTLIAVWTLLWGELSLSNVVSGALVAGALIIVFPISHDVERIRHRFRPLAALRLVGFLASDVVLSTLATAVDVLRPTSRIRTGIVACPLRVHADGLVTFLTNLIALSPGTMPIEVTYNPHVIFVHVLRMTDPEAVRLFVSRLEELSVQVLGGPEALAAVARPAPWPPSSASAPPGVADVP